MSTPMGILFLSIATSGGWVAASQHDGGYRCWNRLPSNFIARCMETLKCAEFGVMDGEAGVMQGHSRFSGRVGRSRSRMGG
ncbi:hypothetical protein Mmc1_0109 [Magnetococcus marinus MC-1]|uniref:Uncharacterized protein n=1 Tax=Magnetococcus marinus (strain ATCC BAA-1437 / JCM 17883 / MC-1) TaxID=156889 RepID=A0L3U5_MAGMM|nr:hypothetical protein Mmc1_0109 [Magnetococcus marinus MC-1]